MKKLRRFLLLGQALAPLVIASSFLSPLALLPRDATAQTANDSQLAAIGSQISYLQSFLKSITTGVSSLFGTSAQAQVVATWYVSPTGSDANPGTQASPFATLQRAHDVAAAGDTIYMRGGTYMLTNYVNITKSGTSGNMIKVYNYPGETPVLDGINLTDVSSPGIILRTGANWWNIKGLEIKNAPVHGICLCGSSSNNTIEANNIHHNSRVQLSGAAGIQVEYGLNNLILNNDVHHQGVPGTTGGDGINVGSQGTGNIVRGNRSWRNNDDGIDLWNATNVIVENNWSFENGYNDALQPSGGDGNGYKLGGGGTGDGNHIVRNNLAWRNVSTGFDDNSANIPMNVYNNTAYLNAGGNYAFYTAVANVLKNNIAFSPNTVNFNATVQHTFNSWNLPVTVSSADFLTTDFSANIGPRQADGSLPNSNFLKLVSGSDLIDRGTNVGLPFSGSAPDLGAYEFTASPTPPPPTPTGGLIAHYTFDNTANDTGGLYNGTLVGSPTYTTGKLGQALSLDGVDDYVAVSDIPKPTNLTLSAWIYPGNNGTNDSIILNKNNSEYDFRLSGGHLTGIVGGTSIMDTSFNFYVNPNQWYHVAYVFDEAGNTHKLYRNGIEVASGTNTATIQDTATPLWIGRHSQFNFASFLGRLDDVRIYNRALSASEVSALANPSTPDTTPPSTPTNLTATAVSSSQINLSWAASTDPVVSGQTTSGVSGYKVYRGGVEIAAPTAAAACAGSTCTYQNTGLTANTSYTYTVAAFDAATPPNTSVQSSPASATTPSGTGDITTGLAHHYKLDETSGTQAADSAGTNPGTLVNGPLWATGRMNNGLSFDGTNDYVSAASVGATAFASDTTISAWLKSDVSTGSWKGAVTQGLNDPGFWWLGFYNGAWQFYGNAGSIELRSANITAGTWYHVAVVRNSSNTILYVNGVPVATGAPITQSNTGTLHLGSTGPSIGEYFDGTIDDVRIYNRALSAADITTLYNYAGTPADTTAPMVTLTAPTGGSTVVGTVALSANATDNVGVTQVEFFVDGASKGTDTSVPYSINWDTTNGGTHPCNGPHTHSLTARASDAAGNNTLSTAVSVNMNNPSYCTSTKFAPNDRVRTTANVNVRSCAGTSCTLLGTQSTGALGTVTSVAGSPTLADSFWWWNINYDTGADGWSVEDFLEKATGDTFAPVITAGPTTENLTATGATITWTTDESSTSQVEYGTTISYGSMTTLDTSLTTSHSVNLTSLAPNTTYHYRVRSKDAAMNEVLSGNQTFTTPLPPDTQAPVRSNGAPTGVLPTGTTQATLSLTTDENATCKYSTTASTTYASMPDTFSTTGAMTHSQSVSGLQNGQTYTYYVRCQDQASNPNTDDYTISWSVASPSPDTTAPSVPTGQSATAASQSQVNVSWSPSTDPTVGGSITSGLAGYRIYHCQGTGCTPSGAAIASQTGTTFQNTGLAQSTTYGYAIAAYDNAGNESAKSGTAYATTQGDTVAPVVTSVNVINISANAATITWTTNEPSNSTVLYGTSPTNLNLSQTNPGMVTGHSVILTGLTRKTVYHFKVQSRDAASNTATSPANGTNSFKTNPGGGVISLQASNGSVKLQWSLPQDGDITGIVIFRSTTGYPDTTGTPLATLPSTATNYRDSAVTPGTVYYYSVYTKDSAGEFSDPANISFTAQAETTTGGTSGGSSGTTAVKITRVLATPMRNDEVKLLQQFLIARGDLAQGSDTGYFGLATFAAVKKFQCDQNIVCTGTSKTTGWGMVGPATRERINSLSGAPAPTGQEQAQIDALKAQIAQLQALLLSLRGGQ